MIHRLEILAVNEFAFISNQQKQIPLR